MPRPRRPLALLAALLVSGGLAACGNHPDEHARVVRAANEGLYLDIGPLKYQVQVSRQLNPNDVQDNYFLEGIPAAQRQLKANEVWFGVFMRVQNETARALAPAGDIKIVDTQENQFRPLTLENTNLFAYRASDTVPAHDVLPLADTPPYDSPVRGSLLLFKLTLTALGNRPLELEIENNTGPAQTGIIDLDV
ncbi:MAG TPA: hypothetical protein VGO81_17715 [Solirubrobacteraceae bacterium]|nr:hypothetical protein [Solirubrobacteraceae bacterium]